MHPTALATATRSAALALGVLAGTAAPALAQDDDAVVAGPSAAIVAGTCDDPAEEIAFDLSPFEAGFLEEDDSASEVVGAESAAAMLSSSTELEIAFDDLVADPHAIVVRDDAENPLACGEIGGYLADQSLLVGVRALEGAGLVGMATLWDDRDVVAVELHVAEELIAPTAAGAEDDGAEDDAEEGDG